MAAATPTPLVTTPCKVVDTANLTISEYFGHVASKDGTCSFAVVEERAADNAAFQTPAFAEYVICNEGIIELEHSDGEVIRIEPGQGAFLPCKLRLRWRFPGPCNYTVVCMPAFSPELAAHEESSGGVATVKEASEEAWQCPQFDEFVICAKGSIDFVYAAEDGAQTKVRVDAGQGIFLPKGLRVKWVWLEACRYYVLCLPAFSPNLCGREAEEGATVAKDSASMQRLEQMHEQTK